jgi:hypothetical protein
MKIREIIHSPEVTELNRILYPSFRFSARRVASDEQIIPPQTLASPICENFHKGRSGVAMGSIF